MFRANHNNILICFLIYSVLISLSGLSAGENRLAKGHSAAAVGHIESIISCGNWGYWIYLPNNGYNPFPDGPAGIYPRGTVPVIFRDGLVWGGIVRDPDNSKPQLRVGGKTYSDGTQKGWIVTPGPGEDLRRSLGSFRVVEPGEWHGLLRPRMSRIH